MDNCRIFLIVSAFLLLAPFAFAVGDSFSIIVLPDTQKYSKTYPEIFISQTEWIAENADELNIVFVSHEGDIVDNWNKEEEWKNADESLSVLDGVVPYGVLPGNHDLVLGNGPDFFNQYFSPARFSQNPWFGGSFPEGKNNNNFQLFSGAGRDFVILHLGFCPSDEAIVWAKSVLKSNFERNAIITTHGYLNGNAERGIYGCGERDGNMQYIWDELVYPSPNVFLVLSGHIHSEAKRTDSNIWGKPVYQLLADYQGEGKGGNGFLRILTFVPDEEKIFVKTYSPYLDEFKQGKESEFVIESGSLLTPFKTNDLLLSTGLVIALIMVFIGAYHIFGNRKK